MQPVGWVERQRNPSSFAETRAIVGRVGRPIECREVFPAVARIERSEIRVQQSSSHGAKRMRNSYHNSAPNFAVLNPGYACFAHTTLAIQSRRQQGRAASAAQ